MWVNKKILIFIFFKCQCTGQKQIQLRKLLKINTVLVKYFCFLISSKNQIDLLNWNKVCLSYAIFLYIKYVIQINERCRRLLIMWLYIHKQGSVTVAKPMCQKSSTVSICF